jgi:hypothetical protein
MARFSPYFGFAAPAMLIQKAKTDKKTLVFAISRKF